MGETAKQQDKTTPETAENEENTPGACEINGEKEESVPMPQLLPGDQSCDGEEVGYELKKSENSEDADEVADIERELENLRAESPEITEMREELNEERYLELRALGLTPEEAYLASARPKKLRPTTAHLSDSTPKSMKSREAKIPYTELMRARQIFIGMDDTEIQRLYKKVTG